MKDDVRGLIDQLMDPLAMLELIDAIQRLGLEYHFKREIKCMLDSVQEHTNANQCQYEELCAATLQFRLLRQHGYYEMLQDVFCKFTNDSGNFMSAVRDDVKGLLSLYEASFHGFEGETIMDKVRVLSIAPLRRHKDSSPVLAWEIEHALEMPIHWRPNQWWSELGLGTSMTFSRDNLLEHYLWNVTMVFEPQHKAFREMTTTMTCVITLINDVYDKLGSPGELELLTHLIDSWDVTRADELPLTMRTCFQALYNITNEIGCWVLKERGIEVHPYLQKACQLAAGDKLNSVECYINESGASNEEAGEHIWNLVHETWKALNRDAFTDKYRLPGPFVEACLNLARASHWIYRYGDGHEARSQEAKEQLMSILVRPAGSN
ncbi:hypothetical protein CRG98_044227 [Punica granatum]|uniref:Uncharacterized protein n=1 Tax=Punica granatum TaxID=22663 RepID=A0A2I0HUJ3_PUNGR|nr:hypothetical protein CRG98_044227 [Punica granatum]